MSERYIEIKFVDPVYCKITNKEDRQIVWEILQYKKERVVKGPFATEKVQEIKSYLDRRNGEFLTGFLWKVETELLRKGFRVDIRGWDDWSNFCDPCLPGITPRDDQMKILNSVMEVQRGYIKAPTGSGKTVLAGLIHSMFVGVRTLFLCHTIDLLDQAASEFEKWGFDVLKVGGGKNSKVGTKLIPGQIVVATIQSFSKLPNLMDYSDTFDVILIDECHHVNSSDGMYAKILERSFAPIRIGLTATDENVNGFLEGYLGPKIGEFTLEEGIENGVLAMPEIHWVSVPTNDDLIGLKLYRDIYSKCIVNNRVRNRLIMEQVKKHIDQGRSVLTLVQEVKHMEILLNMADVFEIPTDIVWSGVKKKERKEIKELFCSKEVHHVVASSVWNEGINIPSLDVVNNAAGGKNETRTIQKIGRGLRTMDGKTKVILIDYLDGYKYLSHHAMMRMKVYIEFGWTMKGVQ